MINGMSVLEACFGEEVGPDLLAAVRAANAEQIAAFREQYAASLIEYSIPELPAGHARPFVTLPLLRLPSFREHQFGYERAWDATVRYLLYVHSIAIEDPIQEALTWASPDDFVSREWRERLLELLQYIAWLAPLIDKTLVVLVPRTSARWLSKREPELVARLENASKSSWGTSLDDSRASLAEYYAWRRGETESLGEACIADNDIGWDAKRHLSRSLTSALRHLGRLQLFVPSSLESSFLEACESAATESGRSTRVVSRLAEIQFPAMEEFDPSDLIRLREDEDAFQIWRSALGRGLERLSSPAALTAQEQREVIWDEMAEAAAGVRSVAAARVTDVLKERLRSFAIGAVVATGLAGAAGSSPVLGSASSILAGVGDALWSYARGTTHRTSARAALSHYLAFQPMSSRRS